MSKEWYIDFLFLDTEVCSRCNETERNLKSALNLLSPIAKILGGKIILHPVHITSKQQAKKHRLISSPTIRVNGIDALGRTKEQYCKECSSMSGTKTFCRTFRWDGKSYSSPPIPMIIHGILSVVFGGVRTSSNRYVMPKNITDFFDGCSSKGNCC